MTRRSYPDLDRLAPNGRWRLEARSPDNGSRLIRDGVVLEGRQWGCFQRDFRYRLFDQETSAAVWSRWQDMALREGSAVDAWVTDGGEAVLRTHAGSWTTDTLLVVDRSGRVRLAIDVCNEDVCDEDICDEDVCDEDAALEPWEPEPRPDGASEHVWADSHVRASTAGPFWTRGALVTGTSAPRRCFSLCTPWARRLVVDLDQMTVVDDDSAPSASIDEAEQARARALLEPLSDRGAGDVIEAMSSEHIGAVLVAKAHHMLDLVPALRRLEAAAADTWRSSTGSDVLGDGYSRRADTTRALVHLALRKLGASPRTRPAVGFESSTGDVPIAPRGALDGVLALDPGAHGLEVLASVGAPDHARSVSRKHGRWHVWSAIWEYDGADCTARLIWSFPEDGEPAKAARRLVRIDVLPPAWATVERQMEVLGSFF